MTDHPALWFVQFEATVAPQKPSEQAKFQLLIAKLGKTVIQQVADILSKPPATERYLTLKSRLLAIYEESENRKLQKLIGEMQLGDQKPSQLLRRMQSLAANRMTDDAITVLWQNHLPSAIRAAVAATDLKDLEKLAAVADKIMEATRPMDISVVGSSDSSDLADQVAKLTIAVADLRKQLPGRGRNRSRSRSRSRARNGNNRQGRSPKDPDWQCFYHFRYKQKAVKCVKPCSWKGEDAGK